MESRTKNSARNIFWGLINKGLNILFPFILRTMLIYILGVQYVGLNSLFASILGVLSLAELGFGNALVFSMYKPVAEKNKKLLSALLNYYRKCYKIIGSIILMIGLLFIPFLRYLIKGTYPTDVNLYLLYAIYLFNTIISYFMYAYKGSILIAFQRNDIRVNIASVLAIIQYGTQIILIILFKNYYAYIIVTPVITIANNLLTSYFVDKYYPDIKCCGKIEKKEKDEITQKVKGMIFQKIGGIILSSVDNIIISAFLGLTILALYSNYYLIISALFGILSIIMTSIIPSVGNSMNTESIEKNYNNFRKFNFIYVWIVSWFSICLCCLYQPFINLWVGKDLLLPTRTMILCVVYFFIYKWMDMTYIYQEAAGLWWENRYIPFIAAIVNLIVNIILVKIIGLPGILISTIVSVLFIYDGGYIYVLFKYYFSMSIKHYLLHQFYYLLITIVAGVISYYLCSLCPFTGLIWLFIKVIICIIVPNTILLVAYYKVPVFHDARNFMQSIIKRNTKNV